MQISFNRFYGLDHLRSFAILLVLMCHYRSFEHPLWIDTIGKYGWTGVDLFFVLSGFLISNQLFKEIKERQSIKLQLFFTKRFFRIIPPYAFTLIMYFSFPFFREREALPSLWKFITFTQNYGLDVINLGTFSHAWSLCIEEQFYLVLPFSILFLVKIKSFKYLKYIIFIIILISLLLRIYNWQELVVPTINTNHFWKEWYMKIYYPTYTRLDGLAIGVLIGYLYQYSSQFKSYINSNGNLLFLSAIVSLGISFVICNEQASEKASIYGFLAVAVSYGLLVISAISKSSFLNKSRLFITSQLAGLSYSIYLSHKGIIHIIQHFLEKQDIEISTNLTLFICLMGCLVGGLLFRYFIEKPSMKFKNYLIISKS